MKLTSIVLFFTILLGTSGINSDVIKKRGTGYYVSNHSIKSATLSFDVDKDDWNLTEYIVEELFTKGGKVWYQIKAIQLNPNHYFAVNYNMTHYVKTDVGNIYFNKYEF